MSGSGSSSDIEVALGAAAAGAFEVRSAYGRAVERHAKEGSDFATQADLDSERVMLEVIANQRPGDGRIGEESGSHLGTGTRRWLVDPLCGTLNFAAQTPLVAVNVALVDGGLTLVGVSADPIAGEVFWADETGAYLRSHGLDIGLSPAPTSRIVDVNCDGPAGRAFVGPQILVDPEFRTRFSPRVVSTTLAVAWVAAGRRAGYISDGVFVDNVHFAAGIAICRAAGCLVTDLAGGDLEKGRGLIVAADEAVHEQLVGVTTPHFAEALDSP